MSLARIGDFTSFVKFVSFSAIGGFTTYWLMNPRQKKVLSEKNVIVATGCDSGLGYSMAIHCHNSLNVSVVACVHKLSSKGALNLKDQFGSSNRFHLVELEVTRSDSVESLAKFVQEILGKNKELQLTALVNNCGVMCFGETEWQTNEIIESQIDVNLSGNIRVVKGLLPLIRQHQSRIINTTSHCGLRALPGLPIYSASKAGFIAFNDSLRLDMKKYGVHVINFIPGSFVMSSNIAAHQNRYASEMRSKFSEEQINFYGDYFDRYNGYLEVISHEKAPQMVDSNIIAAFEEALLDEPPKSRYVCEPFRYTLYHALFKVTPQILTDWLLHKFVAMPEYDPKKST